MAGDDVIERIYREALASGAKKTGVTGALRPITTDFRPTIPSPLRPLVDEDTKAVILGRTASAHKKYRGVGLMDLGCVCESQLKGTNLSGYSVLLDMLYPHVVFICGKRGSGKSYTLGIIAEELRRSNLGIGVVIIDPIGIFWSLKNENTNRGERALLERWGLTPQAIEDVRVMMPIGYYEEMKSVAEDAFSIAVSDLSVEDWCMVFGIERFKTQGLLIGDAIDKVKKGYTADVDGERIRVPPKVRHYSIGDIIQCIEYEVRINSKDEGYAASTRRSIIARFQAATRWGIFSVKGTPITEISRPNQITVLDVSHPKLGEDKRALIAGIWARKIFEARMATSRREEVEGDAIVYGKGGAIPITWLLIDEAHLLLPHTGQTPASEPLIEYAKLGRKPGCALVLATQRPAATNDDIMSQTDILIGHNLALEDDIVALRRRVPSKLPTTMADSDFIRALPVGVAIVADQRTQQRTMVVQLRPRLSAHAGKSAMPKHGPVHVAEAGVDEEVVGEDYSLRDGIRGSIEVIAPTFSVERYIETMEVSEGEDSDQGERGDVEEEKDMVTIMPPGTGMSIAVKSRDTKVLTKVTVEGAERGSKVMIICRTPPKRILASLPSQPDKIMWLSNRAVKGGEFETLPPSNLGKIAHTIEEFLSRNGEHSLVILEGLEYLVSNNDFPKVLRFVEAIHEDTVASSGVFIYLFNPDAFSAMETSKLETEADIIRDLSRQPTAPEEVVEEVRGGAEEKKEAEVQAIDAGSVEGIKAAIAEIKALENQRLQIERERLSLMGKAEEKDRDGSIRDEIVALIKEERRYIMEEIKKLKAEIRERRESGDTTDIKTLDSEFQRLEREKERIKALEAEIVSEPKPPRLKPQPQGRKEQEISGRPLPPGRSKERVKRKGRETRAIADVIDVIPQSQPPQSGQEHLEGPADGISGGIGPWRRVDDSAGKVGLSAVKPSIEESSALQNAMKHLKKRYMGLGKRTESIEDIELIAYPLYRVHIKGTKGLRKKEYIYTMLFDPVMGEGIMEWRRGIKRGKGLSELFQLNSTQITVILNMDHKKELSADDVASRSGMPISSVKRTLSALVKKGLVVESWDQDSGMKTYRRKFQITYHTRPKDIDDMPPVDKVIIERAFLSPSFRIKAFTTLLNTLYRDSMVVGLDVIYYPYYLATVKGRHGRRFMFIDGVSGEYDEDLSTSMVKVVLEEEPPKHT